MPVARTPTGSSSPTPVHLVKVGGVFMNERHVELTPEMEPYRFTTPIPPREPTAIDGTYATLIFNEGRYFLHHHLSGFKALGHYTGRPRPDPPVQRLELLGDDGDLPVATGRKALVFRVVEDPCPFENERSMDLTVRSWTKIAACHRRLIGLWPGFLGC